MMDPQEITDILGGRRGGGRASALRAVLCAASWPYAGAMRLRRWAYRRGLLRSHPAEVPVICVGNLTVGGTGKTPMVAWVVERLKQAGASPAVLTRGYKAQGGPPRGSDCGLRNADCGFPAGSALGAGGADDHAGSDEARLLAGLTGVPVVVDADRVAGAAKAVAAGADVLVMDDGFQHCRLRRGLDIVLVDAVEPFGFGHCLPRGLLREPPAALADAGAVVVTHCDEVADEDVSRLAERLARLAPQASCHLAVHEPTGLIDETGTPQPLDALYGRKVYAFCGLGSPEHFFAALGRIGARLTGRHALADHAAYTPELLAELAEEAARAEASLLVTTQKDHVKLAGMELPADVWQLEIRMKVTQGADELARQIRQAAAIALPPPGR